MITLDLSKVNKKVQDPLELVSYLFHFDPTPSHILKPKWKGPKGLAQLNNQL